MDLPLPSHAIPLGLTSGGLAPPHAALLRKEDALIRSYEPFVGKIVADTRRRLRLNAEVEDLMAFGFAGLLEAGRRYEAGRGVLFTSFAYRRVRGAVLNGAVSMGRLSRRARAMFAAVEAYAAVTALSLGVSESPEETCLRRERSARLRAAVARLPETERAILEGHYAQGRALDEVTAELGYSRAGGRSAHARALKRLHAALREKEKRRVAKKESDSRGEWRKTRVSHAARSPAATGGNPQDERTARST